jgi:hypothetical protein
VDEAYPDARVIRIVLDNLNTNTAASLLPFLQARSATIGSQGRVSSHPNTGAG